MNGLDLDLKWWSFVIAWGALGAIVTSLIVNWALIGHHDPKGLDDEHHKRIWPGD
jgi:hypothetical protein